MPLILLRHTRPEVAEGVCYGRTDIATGADFEAEATRLAAALPAVARIVSSPLQRCRRVAEFLAETRGLTLTLDARIAEMDFGGWEGRRWDALPRTELDAWAADFDGARPHGGESVSMLSARVAAGLADTERSAPPVLWVTHSGVVRAVCARFGHGRGWLETLDFGGWLDLSRLHLQRTEDDHSSDAARHRSRG